MHFTSLWFPPALTLFTSRSLSLSSFFPLLPPSFPLRWASSRTLNVCVPETILFPVRNARSPKVSNPGHGEGSNLENQQAFDHLHHVTIKAVFQATVALSASPPTYRAVRAFGRGGRPWSLAVLGFCLALLGGCPGPWVGGGPLPRRKCSQAGIDSSTDAQYLV